MHGSNSLADHVARFPIVLNSSRFSTSVQILLLGDTSFGENYQQGREQKGEENILKTRGYQHSFAHTTGFLRSADFVLANLETPVTDILLSPYEGEKSYIHKGDLVNTPAELSRQGIQAVSLANNHSLDYGAAGLLQTFEVLRAHALVYFGAGKTWAEAEEPLLLEIKADKNNSIMVAIFAAYNASARARERTYEEAGNATLQILEPSRIGERIGALRAVHPRLLAVAFPHWGSNYKWRTARQQQLAESLLDAGIDLVIGHGAHMIQEIERQSARWIVYGIGNFVFNSPGRYSKYDAPPFSLVASLVTTWKGKGWRICLRLYPIVTDNQQTDYQCKFTTKSESDLVRDLLQSKNQSFSRPLMKDNTGYYFELPVNHKKDLLQID